ncbi:MAG: hypothetical protein MUP85_06695 [Candidatus Lokiarchaeota archaeon]|nr:hypothetical protein [Candidatus Lokiarchaeota archaeon]
MSDQIDKISERKESSLPIDRRKMLKSVLAAGGAITAAAFLDGKWLKPVVKTGILPVHAQASCPFVYFFPGFELTSDGGGFGQINIMVVLALDKETSNPTIPGDILKVTGPISYKILSFSGFTTLSLPAGSSGTMTDGIWPNPPGLPPTGPPIEILNYTGTELGAAITIQWTFNGCNYVYTYEIQPEGV